VADGAGLLLAGELGHVLQRGGVIDAVVATAPDIAIEGIALGVVGLGPDIVLLGLAVAQAVADLVGVGELVVTEAVNRSLFSFS
jgi:hypothetical protein